MKSIKIIIQNKMKKKKINYDDGINNVFGNIFK